MDSSPQTKHAFNEPSLPVIPSSASNSNSSITSLVGSKRPAPTLLPPFEPLSSSPGLPRPVKRQNTGRAHLKYPTPVPTSSTGILSSSPPRRAAHSRASVERAPLSTVPAVELSENGETLIMGRSSNSSHFQLSANRLVSRVHVKARFIAAASLLEPNKMEIICNGWNGLKLHCQNRTWELFKGDSFTSETEGSEIMVDVQDARVLLQWPRRGAEALANLSDSSWDDSPRPQARPTAMLQVSPLRRAARILSPESPTPVNLASSRRLQALIPDHRDQGIEIYEDNQDLPDLKSSLVDANVSMLTEATASFTSEVGEADEHDPDEENDPIVHSFGPFGADISSRLASITTDSPKMFKPMKRAANKALAEALAVYHMPSDPPSPIMELESDSPLSSPPKARSPTPQPPKKIVHVNPAITNHVVNQLAFSRLSSTPLSTIMQHLPVEEKTGLTKDILREVIEDSPCIGIIERQGKDAAGKVLESEYYYVPENDNDEQRRAAVVDGLRKPSLRNCRKQHKQYYWKRPRTP
ncbi:hypothetical protein G7046_g2211 [Stylonectria norvegica]|nr:hypothetical protein G7046_g2211 [Stylonectria norvegica]